MKYPESLVTVIGQQQLTAFWKKHNQAKTPLESWLTAVRGANWKKFEGVKTSLGKPDRAGQFTVFNIGGNKWRLIARIQYDTARVYVRHVFTHAEYDAWSKALEQGRVK